MKKLTILHWLFLLLMVTLESVGIALRQPNLFVLAYICGLITLLVGAISSGHPLAKDWKGLSMDILYPVRYTLTYLFLFGFSLTAIHTTDYAILHGKNPLIQLCFTYFLFAIALLISFGGCILSNKIWRKNLRSNIS